MSDKYAVPNKLPGKTVSILAHRKRRILQDKATLEQKKKLKTERVAKARKHHLFRRPESFVMSYIKAERTTNRIKRIIERKNILKLKDGEKTNQKLLLVMRHAGKKSMTQ